MKDSRAKADTAPPFLYLLINNVGKLIVIALTIETGSKSAGARRSRTKGRGPALTPCLLGPPRSIRAASFAGVIGEAGYGVRSDLGGDEMGEVDDGSMGELDGEVFGVDTAERDEAEDDGDEYDVERLDNEIGLSDNDDDGGDEDMESDGVDESARGDTGLLAGDGVLVIDSDTGSVGSVNKAVGVGDGASEEG